MFSADSASASEGARVKESRMTISHLYSGLALPLTHLLFRTREGPLKPPGVLEGRSHMTELSVSRQSPTTEMFEAHIYTSGCLPLLTVEQGGGMPLFPL